MNDFFIVSIFLKSLCFTFWASLSFYFYSQDTKKRHQQKLDAILREHSQTQTAFAGFQQLTFRIGIWYAVIEALSIFLNANDGQLSFIPETVFITNVLTLNLIFMDILFFFQFVLFGLLFGAFFIHSLGRHRGIFTSNRMKGYFEGLRPVLFEVLLIPSLGTFLSVFHCDVDGETVGELESVQCFDAIHCVLLILAVPMVVLISFYALHLNQKQIESAKDQIRTEFIFMHRFLVQWQMYRIALAGIMKFFLNQVIVVLVLTTVICSYMEWLILKYQPCFGIARIFNPHYAAAFAVLLWAVFVSAIILFIGESGNTEYQGLSELLLFVGIPPVIYGSWQFSCHRERKLEAALLKRCEGIFDDKLPIKERIQLAQSAFILTMAKRRASGVMDLFFSEKNAPNFTKMLGSLQKDKFTILLCQCLTNLTSQSISSRDHKHSGDHRQRMFDTPNLLHVLLHHVKSKRNSLGENKDARVEHLVG